ncbi:MAG: DUF417 family protein [Phycisphaerales bacterium]|nr:DUF417 family protein [Phycisphaerales bacterium]MCB9857061.1 DUF417 family protein [Phycisphaerales bacterium]MCB9861812.1 DUF417 family protein [Phycisphaerales bacterium]
MKNISQHANALNDNTSARQTRRTIVGLDQLAEPVERIAHYAMRASVVIVVGWIGAMKFTSYEAEGISGFVEHSPLMGWVYGFLSHDQFSVVLGVIELAIAALIAASAYSRRAGVIGAAAAIGMFATTLSFMLSTPGVVEPAAGGFPAISAMPGQFLIKDVALLAVALNLLADALRACRTGEEATQPA